MLTLPAPIQRNLAYAQVVDKEPVRTVHLKQTGDMRPQPGQKWIPLVAEQYFTTTPHAFLWHGTMQPFPFFWMTGIDRFSGGHGTMRIKHLSVIPMPLARGPKMDQGELQRYMGKEGLLTPWSIQLGTYREASGMNIPTTFEVTWHPTTGDFTWFRGQITEIEYNQSGKVTRFED